MAADGSPWKTFFRSNSHVSNPPGLQSKRDTYATPAISCAPQQAFPPVDTLITSIIHERYKELIFNELATRSWDATSVVTPTLGLHSALGVVGALSRLHAFPLAGKEERKEGRKGVGRLNMYICYSID